MTMKTLLTTLVFAIVLVAAAIVMLGVKVLFVKGGKFPSGHAHDVMRKRQSSTSKL